MRKILTLDKGWQFSKNNADIFSCQYGIGSEWESISLPHTWNAQDGCSGGNNYYRGECWYQLQLPMSPLAKGQKAFLQFEGANSIANVYLNGSHVGCHEGGYSTFRVDITDCLAEDNLLCVKVDNRVTEGIYPIVADFTFWGGIYRDVSMVIVDDVHFDLDDYGSSGVFIEQKDVSDKQALLEVRANICSSCNTTAMLQVDVADANGTIVATATEPLSIDNKTTATIQLTIQDPILWQGTINPYLYDVSVRLVCNDDVIDCYTVPIGVRYFHLDSDKGFYLNGKLYAIKGVSRHQDKQGMGNAMSAIDHEQDILHILEMGANSVRLSHYQHSSYFHSLCDKYGLIVWAEIPFNTTISKPDFVGVATGDNAKQQMIELIRQNYNHCSIVFWGISNEITIQGIKPELYSLCDQLATITRNEDNTRIVACANVGSLPIDSPLNGICEAIGYNLYFGWAYGDQEELPSFLDNYHKQNSTHKLCVSEIGCGASIDFHTDTPRKLDFSEEYQSIYHENLLQTINSRQFVWGVYVWNMFDFGSDHRGEAGMHGMNNKGLMTYDRQTRKDSFYWYKANWASSDTLHITSKRYIDRTAESISVKVYSNKSSVSLYVNGVLLETKDSTNKIFVFDNVPLCEGSNKVEAIADNGAISDVAYFNKVSQPNASYIFDAKQDNYFLDWFQELGLEVREDKYSVNDTVGQIMANANTKEILVAQISQLPNGQHLVKYLQSEEMFNLVKNVRVRVLSVHQPDVFSEEFLLQLNVELSKISK